MKPIPVKHARRRVEIARSEAGVPHVVAPSWREALYGLGYMHGVDRPTQMLFARAVASGRGAELLSDKPELLETDRFFRRAALYRTLDEEVSKLDDESFGDLTAYCEGVNDGLKQSGRSLPMWATGFRPTPWDQKSVLLLGQLLSYAGLSISQQQNERLVMELVQLGIDDDKLRELFSPLLDGVDLELLRRVKMTRNLSDEALELLADLPRMTGSNAWAVSPARSASGGAMLAADPHLEVNRLPAVWYEAVLRWGREYVMGATLPGCPLFSVARTRHLAWGVTHMKGDNVDFFIEDCRPGGATGWQYRRGDAWRDFNRRDEVLARKGKSPETMPVFENETGVLEGDPAEHGPGLYLSVAWTGANAGAGRAMGTWLDVVRCRTTTDGMDAVRDCPHPALCWVFADRDGHIGMQGSGWFPKRAAGNSGVAPVAAWDAKNHWQGWIESWRLPREYDPPRGFVATANENINPRGGPQFVTLHVPEYRKWRIDERLAELPRATLDDMQGLQYDVLSTQARKLLAVFLPHLPEGKLKAELSAWDCRYTATSREATRFLALYRNVLLEIFGHEPRIGWRRMLYLCTRVGFSTIVLTAADLVMLQHDSLWWAGRDKGELIRSAAARAEREKVAPWSVTNSFYFTNRFFANRAGRLLGFHTSEMPMPGNHATPFQGHMLRTATRITTFAPSYHFVADLGTDEAWTNLPGGPSESRFSPYYKSDIANWSVGKYKRLAGLEVGELGSTGVRG